MPKITSASAPFPARSVLDTIAHLLEKPLKGGMPAMDREAIPATAALTGMRRMSPPSLLRSRVPVA